MIFWAPCSTSGFLEPLGGTISKPFENGQHSEDAKRLLANAPIIRDACDLDLLVFLHRHPRTLLTSEQLAAFVGYDMRPVAKALDAFDEAGILERVQSSTHAARMYVLLLHGPGGGGLKSLLDLASTREGRRSLLKALDSGGLQTQTSSTQGVKLIRSA